jgi:hypothetical protein
MLLFLKLLVLELLNILDFTILGTFLDLTCNLVLQLKIFCIKLSEILLFFKLDIVQLLLEISLRFRIDFSRK